MTRLFEPEIIEREIAHVRNELERLEALAAAQRDRAHQAEGTAAAIAIRHAAERELEDIRAQIVRAQLQLVHPSDRRYAAAQRTLRDLPRRGGLAEVA